MTCYRCMDLVVDNENVTVPDITQCAAFKSLPCDRITHSCFQFVFNYTLTEKVSQIGLFSYHDPFVRVNYWDCFPYDISCTKMVERVQQLTKDRRAYTGLQCEKHNKSATPLFRQRSGGMAEVTWTNSMFTHKLLVFLYTHSLALSTVFKDHQNQNLATRERDTNEIVPVSAEQSSTLDDNTAQYGAAHAIDLDLGTYSQTTDESSSGEKTWLKLNLGSVHCVEKVIVYRLDKSKARSWTCTASQCTCEGTRCSDYTLTVSTETDPDVAKLMCPTVDTCRYLDTVKYERNDGGEMGVFEIAIIGIPVTRDKLIGEITPIKVEQSNTYNDSEPLYAAGRAIDQKFYTCARTEEDSEGIRWIKVALDKVHCVTKVIWYREYHQIHTWTCNKDNCSNCETEGIQSQCSSFTLEVSTDGAVSDLPSISDCRYGDTVKLWKRSGSITVGELVTIEAREREKNEIVPVSAEQSSTLDDNTVLYGAELAIDLDLETYSQTKDESSSEGKTWLKLNLGSVHCVEKVTVYKSDKSKARSWTCTRNQCTCEGTGCSDYTLTVSTEGAAPDLSPFFDCTFYGNTVKYERNDGKQTGVYEMALIRKSGIRDRVAGEITPVSAVQSATKENNEELNGAGNAIDMNNKTKSSAVAGSDGNAWIKISLGSIHCVQQVLRYGDSDAPWQTWTCSDDSCGCVGKYCSYFTLTVSNEGTAPDLPTDSDYKYGDSVKYEKTSASGGVGLAEMVIIGKKVTKERETDEITPLRAEQSATQNDNKDNYGAGLAIDRNLITHSTTVGASDGKTWLKVVFDQVHCVQKVLWYYGNANLGLTWTCNDNNCGTCVGTACNEFTLTVSTEGEVSHLSPVSDCRYGDTVKLERISGGTTRKRVAGEITPINAEHSASKDNDDAKYGAGLAIDMNIFSRSFTHAGSDGTCWLKMTLDHLHCVQKVMRDIFVENKYRNPYQTWTCSETGCNDCAEVYCASFTLTVNSVGKALDVADKPISSDCKVGDTVKLEKTGSNDLNFRSQELVIIGYAVERELLPNEITPVSADHSQTNGDENYGPGKAIDLNLWTYSNQMAGGDGTVWLRVNLGQVHCVQQVIWFYFNGSPDLTWSCTTESDCSFCEGGACSDYTLTVSTEGAAPDLSPVSDCRYGDSVKLVENNGNGFGVYELAIIGKKVIKERYTGELTPKTVQNSLTKDSDETNYGANLAVDLNFLTRSGTTADTEGRSSLSVTLDQVHCVQQVIKESEFGQPELTWFCTETDCTNCRGKHCNSFTLTVSTEGEAHGQPPISDCRYGDTVILLRNDGAHLFVHEMAIIEMTAVSCTEVDPGLNITVDSTLLPAEHGTELPFHCLKKHAKQDTTVRAECQNGMIIFTPGGASSCTKIGHYTESHVDKLNVYPQAAGFPLYPLSSSQHCTLDDNTAQYGAELAFDLDLATYSQTKDESRKTWLKIDLGSVHCVEKVTMYDKNGDESRSWTCTASQCTCEGTRCSDFTLTVSTEGAALDLSPFFDCTFYGNTVKYERNDGKQTGVHEIVIIRKPGIRDKVAGEIIPVRAEHSATLDRDEVNNGVKHAIDMNYKTQSHTGPGSDGNWLKITLDRVHCVKQVWIYSSSSNDVPWQTWTCSKNSCSCAGNTFCEFFKVTVSTEGAASGQSLDSDCSYGDSVTYSRTSGNNIGLTEIVIIGDKTEAREREPNEIVPVSAAHWMITRRIHCVEKVIVYDKNGDERRSWTCTDSVCTCGENCGEHTLTVSTETDPDVATLMCPSVPTCKYLDTAKYERNDGGKMGVFEIAIIGIPVTRDKFIGEITPIKVEQSNTYNDNEPLYAAGRAIDQKFYTCARTEEDLEGIRWIKVTLDKVHCVTKVIWYRAYKKIHTWTCNKDNCSNCEAEGMQSQCSSHTLEVSTEEEASDLHPHSDCRYGDTVKLWKMDGSMTVGELVITGNKATRDRQAGEITPVRAEHSATYKNDYANFGVGHAVDGDQETYSTTTAASDGKTWLKVVFDQVHCVQKVLWYYGNGNLGLTWTCNDNNCRTCVGNACNDYTLTVSTEGEVSHLSPVSDCRYGDTVKLERISEDGIITVYEIVTIVKQAVSCTEVDPGLNITVDSTLLPTEHGTELPFHCLKKHAKQDTTVRAECQNGMIIFIPGGTSSCTKIGK
ncbi:hypothetical protein ACHWQZ_G001565 [Mnemiopsis leidyi]